MYHLVFISAIATRNLIMYVHLQGIYNLASVQEEQLSILRKKPVGALLKYEDLTNMSYGSKVVKETLRMANVLLWYPRVALQDCTIEGKYLREFRIMKHHVKLTHHVYNIYILDIQFTECSINSTIYI